jgi:hypothetical protein
MGDPEEVKKDDEPIKEAEASPIPMDAPQPVVDEPPAEESASEKPSAA